ncbi:MAG: DUF2059 domain-containing protein [Acetobacteraceae bacterium]|nr:MAG: DUF2059 domain-containing protein [Acetobacteraceae bacterium]
MRKGKIRSVAPCRGWRSRPVAVDRLGKRQARDYLSDAVLKEGLVMILSRFALVVALALGSPLHAETAVEAPAASASVQALADVLQLDALFQVLRDEGLAHGESLAEDMFPSGGGADWDASVSRIYDVAQLRGEFAKALGQALAADPAAVAEVTRFFASDLGQRILTLEIEARRTFLDQAAEEAAQVAADDAAAAKDPKVAQLRRMIEAADLVEMNVAGSLSGNLAFMTGMASSGAYGVLPPDQLLSDVWGQEDQLRADTSTWLYSYLGLAYDPLTDAELDAYIAFWESPAGQHFNGALFAAFDSTFRQVSLELGKAAGLAMQGNDI